MKVTTITDKRFAAMKIGSFIKKYWTKVTGTMATNPNKRDKSNWRGVSFFTQIRKTIQNKSKGTKQIPIEAKTFIHTSYIRIKNFVRYFYDNFIWN